MSKARVYSVLLTLTMHGESCRCAILAGALGHTILVSKASRELDLSERLLEGVDLCLLMRRSSMLLLAVYIRFATQTYKAPTSRAPIFAIPIWVRPTTRRAWRANSDLCGVRLEGAKLDDAEFAGASWRSSSSVKPI